MTADRSTRPVAVGLIDGDPVSRVIETVGDQLGVVRVEGRPLAGRPTIGDTPVPENAPEWLVEALFLRALEPRHVLFLCVANSARSQLAEGIARSLAPPIVRISSAGSEPTSVRPHAVDVLDEIGIDIRHHRSQGVDDVERPVDVVITLCEEEVCPTWLEDAWRLHWGLPDPAGVEGSEEERLDAFRGVRDELRRRLAALFLGRFQ